MFYPPVALESFRTNFPLIQQELYAAYVGAVSFSDRLANPEAKRYMRHGVSRRLGLIRKCVLNIFELFPPERTENLGREALEDVTINLHVFLLHVNALQDNLAWAYQLEFELGLDKHHVSLFKDQLKAHLPQPVRDFVSSERIVNWHRQYSTEFRDALAHRIPPYVPPAQLTVEEMARSGELQRIFDDRVAASDWQGVDAAQTEMNSLGRACPQFLHCVATSSTMVLHPQVLSDARTAVALYDTMATNWPPPQ